MTPPEADAPHSSASSVEYESADTAASPTRYTAPVLDAYPGDPRDSEHEYLTVERLADAVLKLAPEWHVTTASLVNVLRVLDECGLLRPRLRLRFTETYAWWHWHQAPNPVRDSLSPEDHARFEHIEHAMNVGRQHFDDPARRHPLQEDALLTAYLEPGDRELDVQWARWRLQVGEIPLGSGHTRPVTRDFVVSLYAPWQRLRAWALLERFTERTLREPRREPAEAPADEHTGDPGGISDARAALFHRDGDPRPDRWLAELEADGWLTALDRARAAILWANARTARPDLACWPAGEALSAEERWSVERARLETRCTTLADPWRDDPDSSPDNASGGGDRDAASSERPMPAAFSARVRPLLELWRWATDRGAAPFAEALHAQLFAAAEWAIFAYRTTFTAVNAAVGALDDRQDTTLALVLRPTREPARRVAERYLRTYAIGEFGRHVSEPALDADDGARFLDYLDEHEMWAWTLEFAGWLEADQITGDVRRDRRFLHTRSLALLNEQLLAELAEQFGRDEDRQKMAQGKTKEPLKAFLCGHRDWRAAVWQTVHEHYELTDTTARAPRVPDGWNAMSPTERLRSRLAAILTLSLPERPAGAARQILIYATVRNFGAHRFSRDAALAHDFGGVMVGGVLFSALLYWRIATTLGSR